MAATPACMAATEEHVFKCRRPRHAARIYHCFSRRRALGLNREYFWHKILFRAFRQDGSFPHICRRDEGGCKRIFEVPISADIIIAAAAAFSHFISRQYPILSCFIDIDFFSLVLHILAVGHIISQYFICRNIDILFIEHGSPLFQILFRFRDTWHYHFWWLPTLFSTCIDAASLPLPRSQQPCAFDDGHSFYVAFSASPLTARRLISIMVTAILL